MQPDHKYLSNLTPLRGLAAMWIVVFHFSEIVAKFVSTQTTLILTKGYLMVDLFFIMSGFIISHVYLAKFESGVAVNFKNFIVARFARIYPLHLFTLLIYVVMIALSNGWNPVQSAAAIPTHLLMLHSFGIHKIFTWNVPSWSISAEWWAYMAFPFLALFLFRKKMAAAAVLLVFVILAYLGIMYWIPRVNLFDPGTPHRQNLDVTFDYGFLRGLAGFIVGMLLYKLYQARLLVRYFQRDYTAVFIVILIVLAMHFGWNDGILIILFAMLVYAFTVNDSQLHTICNNPVGQWLGKISYSIYLVQGFPLIPIFGGMKLPGLVYSQYSAEAPFLIGVVYAALYLIMTIGIATLTYYGVEKPCRKLINRKWGRETLPVYA